MNEATIRTENLSRSFGSLDAAVVLGVPRPDWVLEKDDALVVFGKESDIQKFSGGQL